MLVAESRMVMGKAHVFHVGSLSKYYITFVLESIAPHLTVLSVGFVLQFLLETSLRA